jgi:hypothetical protein
MFITVRIGFTSFGSPMFKSTTHASRTSVQERIHRPETWRFRTGAAARPPTGEPASRRA